MIIFCVVLYPLLRLFWKTLVVFRSYCLVAISEALRWKWIIVNCHCYKVVLTCQTTVSANLYQNKYNVCLLLYSFAWAKMCVMKMDCENLCWKTKAIFKKLVSLLCGEDLNVLSRRYKLPSQPSDSATVDESCWRLTPSISALPAFFF